MRQDTYGASSHARMCALWRLLKYSMDLHDIRSEYDDSLYSCLFTTYTAAARMSGGEATIAPFDVGFWIFFRAGIRKGKGTGKVVAMHDIKVYGGVRS